MVENSKRTSKYREKSLQPPPPAIRSPSKVLATKVLISRDHSRNILCIYKEMHIYHFFLPSFFTRVVAYFFVRYCSHGT